jgi:hypothetical protein
LKVPTTEYAQNAYGRKEIMPTTKRTGPVRFARQHGQSFVELMLFLPILLLMIVIMVDAGFLMNHYLALLDASREGARYGVSIDPFLNPDIYTRISNNVVLPLVQPALPDAWEVDLDVVVSIFSVDASSGTPVVTARYPDGDGWSLNNEGGRAGNSRVSGFTVDEVNTRIQGMSGSPNTGVLLVEVWFDDHQLISVPFISLATSINPVRLHAYTFMPITKASP